MIVIDKLYIDEYTQNIRLKANSTDNPINNILLFHNNLNKEGINISSLFNSSTSIDIEIPISTTKNINGVWFIKISTTTENKICSVSNLAIYYEYVLSNLLKADIKHCEPITFNNCSTCADNTLYAYSILSALKDAITFKYYDEVPLMLNQLDEIIGLCNPIKDSDNIVGHITENNFTRYDKQDCNCNK